MLRYPTELLSEALVTGIIFYGIFLGSSYMAGGSLLGSRLSEIIVGYALWSLMLGAIGNMGWGISVEAQNGTLEQVCVGPLSLRAIFALRALTNLVYDLVLMVVALCLIILLTGHTIHVAASELVPLSLGIAVSIGIGFLVAGVTILVKRSNQFLNLLQFLLLFLVMTPFTDLPGPARYLAVVMPAGPQMGVLRHLAIGQAAFPGEVGWLWLGLLNAVLWLGAGYLAYGRAHRVATERGVLGHY
jgi:ABC-2 type transport system permease protein